MHEEYDALVGALEQGSKSFTLSELTSPHPGPSSGGAEALPSLRHRLQRSLLQTERRLTSTKVVVDMALERWSSHNYHNCRKKWVRRSRGTGRSDGEPTLLSPTQ